MIQFLKEPLLIPGRTEDVAPAGLQLHLLRIYEVCILVFFMLAASVILLYGVRSHQCCHGVDPIVRDLPLITFEAALEHSGRTVLGGFYGRAAVDGVRHSPNHFGVSTEADRTDHASFFVVIEHNRISVGG